MREKKVRKAREKNREIENARERKERERQKRKRGKLFLREHTPKIELIF